MSARLLVVICGYSLYCSYVPDALWTQSLSLCSPPCRCAGHRWLLPWKHSSLISQSSLVGLWQIFSAQPWSYFVLAWSVWAVVCMLREEGHKGALTNPAVGEGWLCVSHHYRCKIGQACFQPLWQSSHVGKTLVLLFSGWRGWNPQTQWNCNQDGPSLAVAQRRAMHHSSYWDFP